MVMALKVVNSQSSSLGWFLGSGGNFVNLIAKQYSADSHIYPILTLNLTLLPKVIVKSKNSHHYQFSNPKSTQWRSVLIAKDQLRAIDIRICGNFYYLDPYEIFLPTINSREDHAYPGTVEGSIAAFLGLGVALGILRPSRCFSSLFLSDSHRGRKSGCRTSTETTPASDRELC